MLRDLVTRKLCPYGQDFEDDAVAAAKHKNTRWLLTVPWWLALLELHGTGKRYAGEVAAQEKELPCAFHHVVQLVVAKRDERDPEA